MRLLVVDDEKIVLDSISLIVKKEELSYVEMQTASTGREAVEKAVSFRPDAVFMDINMPGINGIEAMKSILAIAPLTLFAVITAYDVFDYAKECLQYGACDYIMKPFTPARIVEVISALNVRIKKRDEQRSEIMYLKNRLASLTALANDGTLSMMINGGEMGRLLSSHSAVLEANGGRIALLCADEACVAKARSALISASGTESGLIFGTFTDGKSVLYLPPGFDAEALYRSIRNKVGDAFTLALGAECETAAELWISYRQAVAAFCDPGQAGGIRHFSGVYSKGGCEDVGGLFVCSDAELDAAVESAFSRMMADGDMDKAKGRIAASLMFAAQSAIARSGECRDSDELASAFCDMLGQDAPDGLMSSALAFIWLVRSVISGGKRRTQAEPALDYIENNFASDISPDSAARELSISVATLSRLIKDVYKSSFTELLTKRRISEAERLLRQGELSVKEICFAVGYNDPNYFSRVFKKETGRAPTEYKKGFEGETHD